MADLTALPVVDAAAPDEAAMQPRPGRLRRWLGTLLSIGLSGLFLYFAMRKVDLAEVRQALASANLFWLAPMLLISLINFWLRAVRWAWVFPPSTRPKVHQAFSVFMIGALTNNIAPGRLGDIARAGLIGRLMPPIGASGALATVVLEKVMDGLVLLALLGVAFLLAPLPAWLGQIGALGAVIFLGMLLVLFVLNVYGKADGMRSNVIIQHSRPGLVTSAVQGLLSRFAGGLNALSNKRQFIILLALTSPIWLLDISIMFITFQAFSLALPFVAAMVTMVLLCMGMMIPAAPGFIGTYQFFVITGLQIYHVPRSQALAMAVFLNLFVFAISTLVGLLALSVKGIGWLLPMVPRGIPGGAE